MRPCCACGSSAVWRSSPATRSRPASRPARELLAWLALHPGPHRRFELAQRFWPDVPEPSARASLRTTLHELRRALGAAATHLDVDRERVGLRDVWVDLRDLDPAELLAAGEPLAGIDRDWAIAARDEHRERIAGLLARLADEAGTPAEALPLGARARPPRPAVRGRRPPPDAPARRRRRPRRRDGRVRAPGDPARPRALGRSLARDPAPAGRDPHGRSPAARHGDGARRSAPTRARAPAPARDRAARRAVRRARRRARAARRRHPRARCCSPASPGSGRRGCSPRRRGSPTSAGPPCATGAATRSRSRRTSRSRRRSDRRRSRRCVDAADGERWRLFEAVAARLAGHRARARRPALGRRRLAAAARPPAPAPGGAARARRLPRQRDRPRAPAGGDARRPAPRRPARARRRRGPRRARGRAARARPPRAGGPRGARCTARPAATRSTSRRSSATSTRPTEREAAGPRGRQGGHRPPPRPARPGDRARARHRRGRGPRVRPRAARGGRSTPTRWTRSRRPRERRWCARSPAGPAATRSRTRSSARRSTRSSARPAARASTRARRRARGAPTPAGRARPPPPAGRAAAPTPRSPPPARRCARWPTRRRPRFCERGLDRPRRPHQQRAELLLALGEARLRAGENARRAFAEAAALARDLRRAGAAGPRRARLQRARRDDHRGRPRGGRAARGGAALLPGDHRLLGAAGDRDVLRVHARAAQGAAATRPCAAPAGTARRAAGRPRRPPRRAVERRNTSTSGSPRPDEMLELAIAHRDAERELQARNWLVLRPDGARRHRRTREAIDAHERLAAELRLPAYMWWGPMWRSTLAILEGRFDDAERLIEAVRRHRSPERPPLRGDPAVRARLEPRALPRARRRAARARDRPPGGVRLPLRLLLDAGRARPRRRGARADRLGRARRLRPPRRRHEPPGRARRAHAGDARARRPDARRRRPRRGCEPYADRNIPNGRGAAGYGGATHHVAVLEALLGRDARPRFEQALDRNLALGARALGGALPAPRWPSRRRGAAVLPWSGSAGACHPTDDACSPPSAGSWSAGAARARRLSSAAPGVAGRDRGCAPAIARPAPRRSRAARELRAYPRFLCLR